MPTLAHWLRACTLPVGVADTADLSAEMLGITADSRRVRPGFVFVAVQGARSNGLDFVPQALAQGALAVVTDRPELCPPGVILQVTDAREALGHLAAAFWGHPSRHLKVLGVTGTNGKTTTTILAAQLLTSAGFRAAALGTTGLWTPEGTRPSTQTTPDAERLQETLAALLAEGFTHVAMEVSSHALDQRRVAGVQFAATAWTNLTRDHLDYHGTLEAYTQAKALLFGSSLAAQHAFVNADDDGCAQVWHNGRAQAWSLGAHGAAEHQVTRLEHTAQGLRFALESPGHAPLSVQAPLIGRHNAENLAAALLMVRALGVGDRALTTACPKLQAPRGRLEPIPNSLGALVLVDYAHTPDALEQVLLALRPVVAVQGRLIAVFGAGGDRDPGKRPLMGQVVARLADLAVVTSDNPRTEDPQVIAQAIADGCAMTGALLLDKLVPSTLAKLSTGPRRCGYVLELDRDAAIRRAVGVLHAGDVLVIAGKGHEVVQVVGKEERPFDDAAVAAHWLGMSRHRAASGAPQADAHVQMTPRPTGFAFDGKTAAHATGGHLVVDSAAWTSALCTDSRKLSAGALFVALRGDNFDANAFVGQALDAGARGVVVEAGQAAQWTTQAQAAGAWLVEVDDTLVGLGALARNHRCRFAPLVVGITGSNGKTTTKELTALALSPLGRVHKTAGNLNNQIGLPLTLAGLDAGVDVAVLEMGMSIPGEISRLAHMGIPKMGVVTSIAEAHLLGMGSVQAIADEKADLLRALPTDGVAIVPADEPLLDAVVAQLRCRVLRFGRHAGDVKLASAVTVRGLNQHFVANVGGTLVPVELPGLGVHLATNALAALAVAWQAGANLRAAAEALAGYEPVGQRMLPSNIGAWLVLEDCYNANPRSVEVALDTLATLPGPRAALLGSMLELGTRERELHARVGHHAANLGIDLLIAVGAMASAYAEGAAAGGLTALVAESPEDAAKLLSTHLTGAGTVLVKGSRGARMERAVAALRTLAADTSTPSPAAGATARS